jgi:hypothetical protein
MRVTALTRSALAYRRQHRDLTSKGYEQITCSFGIGRLWELDRGGRTKWRLSDPILGVDGKSIYVKAINPELAPARHRTPAPVNSGPVTGACSTCHYIGDADEFGGFCYRYPPTPLLKPDGLVQGSLPPVKLDWWCGEYEKLQ